ncbi:hypothetical protein N7492_007478 [Penicillium capsulatum]|uniref:Transcription initiation factor TFIID subunit 4 n=1 Tax=Penicillium capsulatum TaxID=69766 RepID=A0A9W9I236_9EURO|nr:hypothetical protein N7492_007478 [Penicillium capsulatum]
MAQTRYPQQQPNQPPAQFPAQPFSPPVSSPSPHPGSPVNGGPAPPPSKRPRLSPLPPSQTQSPYASPSFGAMQLPQGQAPMNGIGANSMPSTPVAPAPAPPLTDVLASSGIDVREEEAWLTRSFAGPNAQAQPPQRGQPPQQPTPINTSFASQASTTGTVSASSSFGELPHIKPAISQESFPQPTSQTPVSFKDANEPTRDDTEAARRSQYHLQEPFLLAKLLEQKIQKRGFDLGVRIPSEGLFHPIGRPQPIEVTGPDGSSVVRTGQTILNQDGAPLVDILNLMSLACEERLRGVPAEWQDVAQPLHTNAGIAATPLKHPHPDADTLTTKPVAERYRGLFKKESLQENKRVSKRTKRNTNAILGESTGNRSDSGDVTGPAPSTPVAERAPSFDKKPMSKKDMKKQVDTKASEAQQHQQSVETARMATSSMLSGRMFGQKKSYSWLKPGGTSSGFSTPSRPNPPTPTAGPEKTGRSGETSSGQFQRQLGTWREDQEKGAGIQVRDILFMLEADGRGIKHVQKGYLKDPKEDRAT